MPARPGTPPFSASGTTVATTIAPGSVSSIRRTRGVTCTWPISQNPATRVTAAASAGSYFLAIEPYRARDSTIGWVAASLAVAFAVRTLLVVFFDRPAYVLPDPLPFGVWRIGGATIQQRSLFVAGAALVLAAAGAWLLTRTRFGRALEAVAQDFDAARVAARHAIQGASRRRRGPLHSCCSGRVCPGEVPVATAALVLALPLWRWCWCWC